MGTPKVFLSSTFVDLASVRTEISRWLTGLFDTKLVIMETFGSDAAPPEINSVRRVRECDLFIGIYANRYGTIDDASGKSITELELDEASASLSAGTLQDILLFSIDENSTWLSDYRENEAAAITGLTRLRLKAKLHTYTSFHGQADLLFCVTRDSYKRLSQILGAASPKTRKSVLVQPKPLRRPVGMEYITAEYRNYFLGRTSEVSSVIKLLQENPVVLLLGESGIGKTSLIHAGLIPTLMTNGWRPVYTRPLGLPSTDITRQLLATIFEGQPFYKGSLVSVLGEISGAIHGQHLLLIVDQFEDILLSRDQNEVDNLLSDLRIIRTIHQPSLTVLLSYRSDLEGRLGTSWQTISGSPLGLPRFYLQGISIDEAWKSLEIASKSLRIKLKLRPEEEERIRRDLRSQSISLGYLGIYPPYVQMVLDHFWNSAHDFNYDFKSYQDISGTEGIITGYLSRQLNYAQDSQGKVRTILVSLVRSYGVKAQKELAEISADTGLAEKDCDQLIERLIDLRLVRHIPPYYEISHDFIARRIANELVDSEEREFKRFRELLTTKAAAFRTTSSILTREELLMLYKHRQRLLPSEEELRLILSTWVHNDGPGLCWLLGSDNSKILSWLRTEEVDKDLNEEAKAAVVLLRRKLGEMPLSEKDYQAFKKYQLSAELASLILESANTIPRNLLLLGLRHRREEVHNASIIATVERIKSNDYELLNSLLRSSSTAIQEAFEEIVLRFDISIPKPSNQTSKAAREFVLLKSLALTSSAAEAKKFYLEVIVIRLRKRIKLFARALLAMKQGRLQQILKRAKTGSRESARIFIMAPRCISSPKVFSHLTSTYCEWNSLERNRYDKSPLNDKACMLSATIRQMMKPEYLNILRECFRQIRLTSSSREIVLAILEFGSKSDIKLVFERIEKETEKIDYWNNTELGRTAGRNKWLRGKGVPKYLRQVITTKEFNEYILPSDRKENQARGLLPLACSDNRALYIRLAAYAAIGSCTSSDARYLLELTTHQYTLIARASAVKLVHLFGIDAFRMLSDKIDDAMLNGKVAPLSKALRYAEMQFYAVIEM